MPCQKDEKTGKWKWGTHGDPKYDNEAQCKADHPDDHEGRMSRGSTKILDILSEPWAILPSKLKEITSIYDTHLRGEKIDLQALEAKLGMPLNNSVRGYDVIDGVAIIPIVGVISKRANMFMRISGGVSSQLLLNDIMEVADDPHVKAIMLHTDSPGGAVDGTPELASAIYAARERKPVIAYSDGAIASAAYWIGSAADKIYISSEVVQVGSIGVVAQHIDYSEQNRQRGIRVTEITAGKYKRIASENAPLTEEGRDAIKDRINHVYSVFVNEVAKMRGVSVDTVLTDMADGRIFQGSQAIKAGLVDGMNTFNAIASSLADGRSARRLAGRATMIGAIIDEDKPVNQIQKEEESMTKDELKEKHPDVYKQILEEGNAAGTVSGETAGREAERKRIADIEALAMPGHEALIAKAKADGTMTADMVAKQIIAAEKATRSAMLDTLKTEGKKVEPVATTVDTTVTTAAESKEDKKKRLTKEWLAANPGQSFATAAIAVSKANPELFKE